MENNIEIPQKDKKINLPYVRSIPLLSTHLKDFNSAYHRDTCVSMSITELYIIAMLWNQSICLATEIKKEYI